MESSIFDFTAKTNSGADFDFSKLRGKVLLVVNTASKCGFTPQYKGLEALHRAWSDKGLAVIGFPCDQFGHQEPGDSAAILSFCEINYGVTFPLMAKIEVNGSGTHPVFAFLKHRAGGVLGTSIKWNFTKFLVAKDGTTISRYAPTVEPETLTADIEKLLAE